MVSRRRLMFSVCRDCCFNLVAAAAAAAVASSRDEKFMSIKVETGLLPSVLLVNTRNFLAGLLVLFREEIYVC
jgi:hypothetical protein